MLGQKEENNTISTTKNITRENKSEGTGERMKTKKISRQNQIIQTKQDIPKQRKKILPASSQRTHEDTNSWITMNQNNFGAKYGNEENIIEKINGLTTWKKSLKYSKKTKIYTD